MKLSLLNIPVKGFFKGINTRIHRALFRGMYPTFLLMSVTEKCNCRCSMCNIWQKKNVVDIDLKTYKKFFSDNLWEDLAILSLTGGEPFLRNDLKDLILLAVKKCPGLKRISMPSNGLLTKKSVETVKSILADLPKHITLKIGISIDGPREMHDKLRGVPGCYDKAMETIHQFKKIPNKNFEVGILSLITSENALCLKETYKIFQSITDQITFTLSTESEFFSNLEEGREIFPKEETKKILSFIDTYLIPEHPEKAYLYTKYKDHLIKKQRTYPCLAGYKSAYLDSKGNLLPCHYLGEKYTFTNILKNQGSLEEAWFSADAKKIRTRIEKNPYCRNCSNNCDSRNLIQEDFFNFLGYLLTHPSIPIKALLKKK
jgi:MoaA/NifB/PqqE/SkfB family radical SAM enzyme